MTMEAEARPQMEKFLRKYGLQITLKTLIDSLENWEPFDDTLIIYIIETLKGIHKGYLRRHENEKDD